jgi:hypothetical protein
MNYWKIYSVLICLDSAVRERLTSKFREVRKCRSSVPAGPRAWGRPAGPFFAGRRGSSRLPVIMQRKAASESPIINYQAFFKLPDDFSKQFREKLATGHLDTIKSGILIL